MSPQARKERLIQIIESLPEEDLEEIEAVLEQKASTGSFHNLSSNLDKVIEEDRTLLKKLAE